ncbi:hypothetical protein [Nitratireductor sp. ZSWI3]|uniref:hypothetical protein n=1 Tax=Nitratireductor sp. ZSWI3 TaxID=2966359 RepID=UPI00214F95D1|nr:hypothetical protein [Nitratireductor sp. ZSWI3]MCR4264717.1 hypothetical protein [Nitratireductor sp. ZSWI3]
MLGTIFGLLKPTVDTGSAVYGEVQDVSEILAPGSMEGQSLTGNLLNDHGLVGDVLENLGEGNLTGAVVDAYADVIGPGGAINNLGQGGGLGIEGLLGNVLGTADGLLGTADGLLGSEGGLLGGLLG